MFFIFFSCLVVYAISLGAAPLPVKSLLDEMANGAALKMESTGGLTTQMKTDIQNRITDAGLNISMLTIDANFFITPSTPLPVDSYGNKVWIKLTYQYHQKSKNVSGTDVTDGVDTVKPITAYATSISKAN